MTNAWVAHVKQYAKDHGLTYACAVPDAAKTYTKKSEKSKPATPTKSIKEQSDSNNVRNLEFELKHLDKDYTGKILGLSMGQIASGRRTSSHRKKELGDIYNDYEEVRRKLQQLTNKTYPAMQRHAEINKEVKKK